MDLLYLTYDQAALDRLINVLPQVIDFEPDWSSCDCYGQRNYLDSGNVIQIVFQYTIKEAHVHDFHNTNFLKTLLNRVELFKDRPEGLYAPIPSYVKCKSYDLI